MALTYKNDVIEFHKKGIESKKYNYFIPFTSINCIDVGKLPLNKNNINSGLIIAFTGVFIYFFVYEFKDVIVAQGFFDVTPSTLRTLMRIMWVMLACGSLLVLSSLRRRYAMNIYLVSGTVYSLYADNKKFIFKGYRLLLDKINEYGETGGVNSYNFRDGNPVSTAADVS